jgi:hypothetical protein
LFESSPNANQDLDTVLRIASLALAMGEAKPSVVNYLTTAAALRVSGQSQQKDAPPPDAKKLPDTFLWMRAAAKAARMQQEAAVLKKLASSLNRMK